MISIGGDESSDLNVAMREETFKKLCEWIYYRNSIHLFI